jgi:hypothetical protein
MGKVCGPNGRNEKCIQCFGQKNLKGGGSLED